MQITISLPNGTTETREVDDAFFPATVPPSKEELTAYLASVRYTCQTSGVSWNGITVPTGNYDRGMISDAVAYMENAGIATTTFKVNGAFQTLDLNTMKQLAMLVGSHVQACFAKEAELSAQIESGALTSYAGIDAAFVLS